jgi:hypothetical protein
MWKRILPNVQQVAWVMHEYLFKDKDESDLTPGEVNINRAIDPWDFEVMRLAVSAVGGVMYWNPGWAKDDVRFLEQL